MKYYIFIFCVLVLFSGCAQEDDEADNRINFDITTFEREREAWKNLKIKDYTITQTYRDNSSGSGLRYKIIVNNSIKNSAEPLNEYSSTEQSSYANRLLTITGLYNKIAQRYYDDVNLVKNNKSYSLTVKINYHSVYHYPTSVDYYCGRSGEVGNEGFLYGITSFTKTPQ